jgi:catechol 2,3-dioxygenase-like lactoylglutathione lyase family enzyme
MEIIGLQHVAIIVSDYQKTAAIYRGILGAGGPGRSAGHGYCGRGVAPGFPDRQAIRILCRSGRPARQAV